MQDRDTRLIIDAIDYLQAQTRLINSQDLRKETAIRLRILANELDSPESVNLSPEDHINCLKKACDAGDWDEVGAHAKALRATAMKIMQNQTKIATEQSEWNRVREPILLMVGLMALSTPMCRLERLRRKTLSLATSFFPTTPLVMANVIAFPVH